jgi:glutaredoxin/uncharacterized protein (DUF302 family)
MTFSYFRKSTFGLSETLQNVKKAAEKAGLKVLGEVELKEPKGYAIHVSEVNWTSAVVAADPNVVGFLPSVIVSFEKDGKVMVGTGRGSLLGGVTQNVEIARVAEDVEKKMKEIVNVAAGAGDLKPTKIKVYSTTTCPYCKMEKAWLDENKISYENVMVDVDRAAGEEMVKKTGQMGVPVTEIQYEDSEPDYIIGFDKPQLSQILNVK